MKYKVQLNRIRTRYTKVPSDAFKLQYNDALLVYCIMCTFTEDFQPSVRYFSNRLKWGMNRVRQAISILIDSNMIMLLRPTAKGKRTLYAFVSPDQWTMLTKNVTQTLDSVQSLDSDGSETIGE